MEGAASQERARSYRGMHAIRLAFWISLCMLPHLHRIQHASLFSDDITRIALIQTNPFSARLFRPFNEHIAPLFEIVTTVAWNLAGQRLTHAPLAFTLISFAPFVLSLVLLAEFVRRQLGSVTASVAAVMVFGISTVHVEAIYWYSASSFTWALMWTIVVLICCESALRSASPPALLGAALAALCAPAFSAVGLIAGPLGTIQMFASKPFNARKSRLVAFAPVIGTVVYVAFYLGIRPTADVVSETGPSLTFENGFLASCRAPFEVLLPGLIGVRLDRAGVPLTLILLLSAVGIFGLLSWAWKSPARPLVVSGAGLIVGGYALTYLVRAHHGTYWLLQVQRYHLFPQAGLALLVTVALRRRFSRADRRPLSRMCLLGALAAMLIVGRSSALVELASSYHFPEQKPMLVAMERLDEIGRERGITRQQMLTALDPIRTRWYPHEDNALAMLPDPSRVVKLAGASVRSVVLNELTLSEREALCGEMDASAYVRPTDDSGARPRQAAAVGKLVGASEWPPHADRSEAPALPGIGYVEYQFQSSGLPAQVLSFTAGLKANRLLISWTDAKGRWSPSRSAHITLKTSQHPQGWMLPLDRLPHWGQAPSRRIRICTRSDGPLIITDLRLLR
jgi:hypothetical protein